MDEFQFVGRCFPGFLRVLNQFPTEQEHLVYTFVEKAGDLFAPRFGVGDDGRVMPDDDGLAVQSQCTEEDDGFYPPERGGIEHVVFFLAEENLFGGVKHELQATGEIFAFVHYGMYSVIFEQRKSV